MSHEQIEIDWHSAQAGNKEEIAKVVEKYRKLAYSIAWKWVKSSRIDEGEAIGRAEEALLKCATRDYFDPETGDFTSYLAVAVENELRMWARKKHKVEEMISLDSTTTCGSSSVHSSSTRRSLMDDLVDDKPTPEQKLDDKAEMDAVVRAFYNVYPVLSGKESLCLFCYMKGRTQKETADIVGLSQSYVSRTLTEAKDKLRVQYQEITM